MESEKQYYRVYVSIPFSLGDAFAIGEDMLKRLPVQSDGSGAGFGNRDLEFTVHTPDELENLKSAVRTYCQRKGYRIADEDDAIQITETYYDWVNDPDLSPLP